MALHHLPDHIHFCEIGGQRVFLDLLGDRYFCLPPAVDTAFSSLAACVAEPAEEGTKFLEQEGILIAAPQGRPVAATRMPMPTLSLVEEEGAAPSFSWSILLESWLLLFAARRGVLNKQLPRLLGILSRGRQRCIAMPLSNRNRAAGQFRAARRFVPIAPNCLYDSIALCRFLQRRGIAADLVIGAKLHPFGAHCWLQDGATVLNDALAAARGFEPILVV